VSASVPPILEPKAEPTTLTLEEDLKQSAREIVRLLPVLGAVGLAVLYLVGALVKVGQLQSTGVAVGDALPLIPLSQLLAAALPILVPTVILLPLTVFGLSQWWRWSDRVGAWWKRVDALAARAGARAASIDRRLDELESAPSRARTSELRMPIEALRADVAALGRVPRIAALLRPRRWLLYVIGAIVLASWATLSLMMSPFMVTGIALALAATGALRRRPVMAGVAAYGVFLGVVLVEAYAEPSPLPVASVRTLDHRLERGRLIAATDAQWHLAMGGGQIRSVPTSRIVATDLRPMHEGGSKPIWKLVRDLVR
jgi:hypothetical protein